MRHEDFRAEGSRYIRVNGTTIYITIPHRTDLIRTDECSSEQCEGCGEDIVTTGLVVADRAVRCTGCGATYDIREW